MTEHALAEIADEIERLFGESREAHAAFNASEGDRNCATAADESWLRLTRAMVRHVTPILAALRRPEPEPAPAADAVERAARAIAGTYDNEPWDDLDEEERDGFRDSARAALSALPSRATKGDAS